MHTSTCTHACMHTHTHTQTRAHACAHTHTHTHAYIYIYIYTHTHTYRSIPHTHAESVYLVHISDSAAHEGLSTLHCYMGPEAGFRNPWPTVRFAPWSAQRDRWGCP